MAAGPVLKSRPYWPLHGLPPIWTFKLPEAFWEYAPLTVSSVAAPSVSVPVLVRGPAAGGLSRRPAR